MRMGGVHRFRKPFAVLGDRYGNFPTLALGSLLSDVG